jgi:hypothetical protein
LKNAETVEVAMPPKKGSTTKIGQTATAPAAKEFAGSGVEGQKGAPPAEEEKPAFDKAGASSLVTMRGGKPCRIWFRAGKEIGAEDA